MGGEEGVTEWRRERRVGAREARLRTGRSADPDGCLDPGLEALLMLDCSITCLNASGVSLSNITYMCTFLDHQSRTISSSLSSITYKCKFLNHHSLTISSTVNIR